MPQETNFNVSPYFDDFDPDKDFYKVLFKPGYPIQARELTTLQSILQNQVEQFGKHFFKDGSAIIPDQIKYENPIYAVEIQSNFNGLPISLYFDDLLNKKIKGELSGVTAQIFNIIKDSDSERNNYTIYVKYLESGGTDFSNKSFQDGETLILQEPLSYGGKFVIQTGQGVCNTISTNCNSKGSSVSIADTIYFVRGTFTKVSAQTIILDQYSTNPSYRVGFDIIERIVTSDEDESLFDNARSFTNYTAPGADRFQILLELSKKSLDDFEVDNFIEILRVEDGIPQFFDKNPSYNLIRDELAKRTYDQSGDFFIKPFSIFVRDSLNDRVLTNGIYFEDQSTISGNTPSESSMVYQIGPGKAYVNGYDVETISVRLLDVEKPRTTKSVKNEVVSYNAGTLLVVNNSYGSATIGLGTETTISLRDSRIGSNKTIASGNEIGVARVYDYVPESDYVDNSSRLELRLFDIQTYTEIGLSTSISSLTVPAYLEGKKSGASGYLRYAVSNSDSIVLYQTSGKFLENESISINGIDNGRLINSVRDYSLSDIKSIYSNSGISAFNADLVLNKRSYISKPGTVFKITQESIEGTSTVTAGLKNTFINILKEGDIISYANPDFDGDIIYNKVNSVSAGGTIFTITELEDVINVCDGALPQTDIEVTNIIKVEPSAYSNESSLLTRLNKDNINALSLENNQITQRRQYSDIVFNGFTISVSIDPLEVDVYFDAFDEDRFVITYSDGSIELMRRDKYDISEDGKTLTFNDLSKEFGTADVIATVTNLNPNSKTKKLNKVASLVVNKSKLASSGIGSTTLNDGLAYSQIYGLRVQDKEICLNVPDVLRVVAIYESIGTGDPKLPSMQLISFTGPTLNNQDFLIGEQIIGQTSGAAALVINRVDTTIIEYVYLNTFQFVEGEVILGKDSTTKATITTNLNGHKNITQNFVLDDGQRQSIYDYGRIVRKKNTEEPKRKIKIIFQHYTIDPSDDGEFITVNSYPEDGFKHDVPSFENSRLTDYIDIRPRVSTYTSSIKSPFEFDSRNFASDGQYSKYILAPGENLILNYSFYIGRIDRVFLNSDGTFEISQGIAAEDPITPSLKTNSLDIATIYIPPYVYDVKNINVDFSEHKKYNMRDISYLEDRIDRLERFTTLSMLESKTENFIIRDSETGLDRFKCGFFVDNFSTHDYHEIANPSFKSCIDTTTNSLRPEHYTTSIDLQLGSEVIAGLGQTFMPTADHSFVEDLGSVGVKKTGDLISLDYSNVLFFEQPYATKTESVTPFLVKYWTGSIQLNPSMDTWVEERAVTTTSFNQLTTVRAPLPDINITLTNNVVVNNTVFRNPVIVQSGIPPGQWISNARGLLRSVTRLGGVGVSQNNLGNANRLGVVGRSGFQGNNLHLEVLKSATTAADKNFIRRLLPADVANSFITQIERRGGQDRVVLNFTPGQPPQIRQDTSLSTTNQSTSNTTTIIIPPEIITQDTVSTSISNYTEPVRYLRNRNIEFDIKGLKPLTRFYPFFEGIDVSRYIAPKLIEISMISGKFSIGETIESDPHFSTQKFKFRLCKPNHKFGPHNNPTERFKIIPYNQIPPPENYTESSTYLNVDTRALQLPSEVDFYGSCSLNMRLIGKSSGAVARITNIRLISDSSGRLIGSLLIPDPKIPGNPQWINGENTFTVIDTPSLSQLASDTNLSESSAESEFTSSAITNVTESKIITTRNVTIIPSRNINTTTITNTRTNTTTVNQTATGGTQQVRVWETHDPLAQSFYVREDTGVFLTGVDIFFNTADESIPVTLQIRPMIAGVPSNVVVPFSEVTLSPDQINLSGDGSVPTRFTFPSPVYLSGPQQLEVRQAPIGSQQTSEYSIVLLSNSPQYRIFIAELGQTDILTKIKISQQPTLGSLFKSQNGSTWNPFQLEDMKYRIYRADFVSEGLVRFFNPKLSLKNKKVTVTGDNQLLPLSKRVIVGLGSTGYDQNLIVPGVTLSLGDIASGTLIGIAGSIAVGNGVTISNAGFGYTDGTFNNIELLTETGYGQGAKADIIVTDQKIISVDIKDGGMGYEIGDSLLIPSIGKNVGFGGRVVVSTISSKNTFVIDEVQGQFTTSNQNSLQLSYINSSGITTYIGNGITISSIMNDSYYDGLHMKIIQMNHGMHSQENYVRISDLRPSIDEPNSKTVNSLPSSENSIITLNSTEGFETFEGLPVGPLNTGYLIIGNEVVGYSSVSSSTTIENLTRGIDGTEIQSYDANVSVSKYEFNGISLRRINKVHNLSEVNFETHKTDLNSYHIKVNMDGTDFESNEIGNERFQDLYFKKTEQMGESGTVITNNIQYEAITPNIAHIVPTKTNINSRIRTFTGTSVSGNENSFTDDGYSQISLDQTTYFANPKLICSDINESKNIEGSPGNRSLTLELLMSTTDSRVSPIVDTIRTSAILTSNLINSPLGIDEDSNYANDDSVRSLFGDNHAAIYISKPITLKIPANSLKVLLSASRNEMNDIRVLYQLFRSDSPEQSQNYELFPGYSNYFIDTDGVKKVIDPSLNDGSADSKTKQNSDRSFKDYEYTIDNLPEFTGFSIKIVMASKNQATPPIVKQLRAIATVKPKV